MTGGDRQRVSRGAGPMLFERAIAGRCRFAVLGSSSGGNCSAIVVPEEAGAGLVLIDAGFGPRVLRSLLEAAGLGTAPIRAIVLTHLDVDHANPVLLSSVPSDVPVYLPRRHLGRAQRDGIRPGRLVPFAEDFEAADGVVFSPMLTHHDSLGVAAFRVRLNLQAGTSTLGYATDVGRPTAELADHVRGVDVLAVESNYCPQMQRESDRPEYLKRRIMGGSGHLSNEQSASLAASASPGRVVLLHLSRQCNTPERALEAHRRGAAGLGGAGFGYDVVVSSPRTPTAWIEFGRPTL